MVRKQNTTAKLFFKRLILETTLTLGFIVIKMTTKETTDIFAISFGWSTVLKYLYYADIYNVSALTNQKLTTAILQAIGDDSNKNDNENRKTTMLSTKLSQYADKALISTFNKYLIKNLRICFKYLFRKFECKFAYRYIYTQTKNWK